MLRGVRTGFEVNRIMPAHRVRSRMLTAGTSGLCLLFIRRMAARNVESLGRILANYPLSLHASAVLGIDRSARHPLHLSAFAARETDSSRSLLVPASFVEFRRRSICERLAAVCPTRRGLRHVIASIAQAMFLGQT